MADVSDNVSDKVVDEIVDESKIQIFKHRFTLPGEEKTIDYILIYFNDPDMNCQKIQIRARPRIRKAFGIDTHNLKDIIADKNLIEWKQIPKSGIDAFDIKEVLDKDMYTYCLINDVIRFAEFKPKNDKYYDVYNEYSKHLIICDANEICVSGELIKKQFTCF